MKVRACCNNCGFTGDHDLPYRAKIASAMIDSDTRTTSQESSFTTDGGKEVPFLCTNCGRPDLEVIYWGDGPGKKAPFIGEELHRLIDG
jgi:predicted RNA-binding Zn-ribbon protein involved in translation (DUF1610 family)